MDSDCVSISTIVLPDSDMVRFQVQRDSTIIISTTNVQVVTTYLDPVFDPYEPSFTVESNGCTESLLLYPTAIVNVRQKFNYGGAGAIPIAGNTAALDNTILYLKSMDCSKNETCEVLYSSTECIICALNTNLHFQMNAWMELPGNILTNPVKSPAFFLLINSLDECTAPGQIEDLTLETKGQVEFPVRPTVDEIVIAVRAETDMAVIIENILVEDFADGSSTLISVSNKIKMMREPLSYYFNDVHFCRYETALNGCSNPFYFAQNTSETIMDTVPLNTLNTIWRVPGKGYFQCEDVEKDRNVDRISINPSTWFTPMNGIYSLRLTITARLSTCSSIVNRRTLSSPQQIIKLVSVLHIGSKTDDKFKEILTIGLGVGIPLLLLFCCCVVFFLKRRRNRKKGSIVPQWS